MNSNYIQLNNRGMVVISGAESFTFLQNIVSNDLNLLNDRQNIHACLLTPQGKYLHDFFIYRENDKYLIECEGGARTQDLFKRLSLYKLRAKIEITAQEYMNAYCTIDNFNHSLTKPLGNELPFAVWDKTRIMAGIIDGTRDAEIGVSTLSELNLDICAVSYTKGCYVGQELVARMHNRNLGKKHLRPILFTTLPVPEFGSDIIWNENIVGEMRSHCDQLGMVLIKDEYLTMLPKSL